MEKSPKMKWRFLWRALFSSLSRNKMRYKKRHQLFTKNGPLRTRINRHQLWKDLFRIVLEGSRGLKSLRRNQNRLDHLDLGLGLPSLRLLVKLKHHSRQVSVALVFSGNNRHLLEDLDLAHPKVLADLETPQNQMRIQQHNHLQVFLVRNLKNKSRRVYLEISRLM